MVHMAPAPSTRNQSPAVKEALGARLVNGWISKSLLPSRRVIASGEALLHRIEASSTTSPPRWQKCWPWLLIRGESCAACLKRALKFRKFAGGETTSHCWKVASALALMQMS